MTSDTTHDNDPVMTQAAIWLSRLDGARDRGWDDPEFLAWIGQADSHRLAFAEISDVWFGADELGIADPFSATRPQPTAAPAAAPVRRWRHAALALVVLAAALLPDWRWLWLTTQADYSAPRGGSQVMTLPDGSALQLAGDSAVRWLDSGRGIALLRGEVVLDVVRDTARPFRVEIGASTVTVTGTRFGVTRRNAMLRVGVMEGHVAVTHGSDARALSAGQQVVLGDGGIYLDDNQPADFFSWSNGRLIFRNRSLQQVVRRLQPFTERRIWLRPGTQRPALSAVVTLDRADRVAASLAQQAGLQLTTLGPVDVLH